MNQESQIPLKPVGTGGFEPPKSKQQIYSLSHLATLVYPRLQKNEPLAGIEPATY